MRVVLDTNTVVSGFLWDSQPRALIDAAVDERIVMGSDTIFKSCLTPLRVYLQRLMGDTSRVGASVVAWIAGIRGLRDNLFQYFAHRGV